MSCDDLSWKYTATLTNGAALPSYVTFSETSSGGLFALDTSDVSKVGTYFI